MLTSSGGPELRGKDNIALEFTGQLAGGDAVKTKVFALHLPLSATKNDCVPWLVYYAPKLYTEDTIVTEVLAFLKVLNASSFQSLTVFTL